MSQPADGCAACANALGPFKTGPQRLDATVIAGRSRLDLRRLDADPDLVGRGAADAVLLTAGWRAVRGSTWTIERRVSLL